MADHTQLTNHYSRFSHAQLQFAFTLLNKIWIALHGPKPSVIDHGLVTLARQVHHVDKILMHSRKDIKVVLEGLKGLEEPSERLIEIMTRLARCMERRTMSQEPACNPFEYIQFALLPGRYHRAMHIQRKLWARTWLLRHWLRSARVMGHQQWSLPISMVPQDTQRELPWGYAGSLNFPPVWASSPHVRYLPYDPTVRSLNLEYHANSLVNFGSSGMPGYPAEEPHGDRAPPSDVAPENHENSTHLACNEDRVETMINLESENDCLPARTSAPAVIGRSGDSNTQFLQQLQQAREGRLPQHIFLQNMIFSPVCIPPALDMTEMVENWNMQALHELHRAESQGIFSELNLVEMHNVLSRTWSRYTHAINRGSQLITEGSMTLVHLYAVLFRLALLETLIRRSQTIPRGSISVMRLGYSHDAPSVVGTGRAFDEPDANRGEEHTIRMRTQFQRNHNRMIATRQRLREVQLARETQTAIRQVHRLATRFQTMTRRQIAIRRRWRRRSASQVVPNAQRVVVEEMDARDDIDLFHRPGSPRHFNQPVMRFDGPQFRQYRSLQQESEKSSDEECIYFPIRLASDFRDSGVWL